MTQQLVPPKLKLFLWKNISLSALPYGDYNLSIEMKLEKWG